MTRAARRLACGAGTSVILWGVALGAQAQTATRSVDLLVTGGTVVSVDAQRRVIAQGAVAIDAGRIVAVGPAADVGGAFEGRETLDAAGGIVLPGLVNAHTHAPMVLFRGIADDRTLMDWLEDYVFPAEARNVDAAFVLAGTRLAALEMIRSGTTTFADMYYFEDQVAEAANEAGLRVVAGETIIGFPAPDNATLDEALAYTERFLEKWTGHPLVTPAVAPHSPYLLDPEALERTRQLADRFGAPLLIHLSETQAEQERIARSYAGRTPTEHLRELGFLRPGVLAAHGVWLSASDRRVLREAGVGVAHCPQSNMKLASGSAPVAAMLREGLRLGLGTDGAASNNDLDMFEEMLTAALLSKSATGDPTAAPAEAIVEMATLGGARALGMEAEIGSLEPGKLADLVIVDVADPRLQPVYDPVSHIVYAVKGSDVRHSVIGGRVVMRDRRVLTLDSGAVVTEARGWGDRIRESLAP